MMSERLTGEASHRDDLDIPSVSKRLVRSLSNRIKKKNQRGEVEEEDDLRGVSLRCLTLYGRGGGCKVGADTCDEFGDLCNRRRSSASEEGKGYNTICGTDESPRDCFSYGVKEKFWKKNNKKVLELNSGAHVFLPEDILEMCFVRLPLTSLMTSRLVCKKWRNLTVTSRFMQMRREGLYQSPWLFLFGVVKDGFCSGEIHAFDVSLNKWHKINAEVLKGRFLFSVTSIQEEVYVVGGCSNFGRLDRSSKKTHKSLLVFSPSTKSFHKAASMKYARSKPILGVHEVTSDCLIIKNQQNRQDRRIFRSRIGGVSDIYEDPHRLSVRRQSRNSRDENEVSASLSSYKFVKQKSAKDCRRFVLIAVGGLGSYDEPLDSGEIYDSLSNRWMEIQKLPFDFGPVCSGVVCNGMFYVYSETDRLSGYDIERGFWVCIQTTPFPSRVQEYYPKLVSCKNRLFMISVFWCEGDGQIGRRNKAVRKVLELDLVYLTWTQVSVHPDAPMDWNAGFVADGNFIFGVEMFKIFGQVLDFLTMCDVSDTGAKWRHVSRNHVAAHELDAISCMTKSMAVLHL